jgi:type I restriction enzyme, S subunit
MQKQPAILINESISLEVQRRIIAYLDGLQAKVNVLRELQAESGKELSALMPSILDKAFKGEI